MTSDESRNPASAYDVPSADLVDRALARIGNPQHRQVFYSRLENPEWVMPLTKKGAFADVPAIVVDEQGATRSTGWPQGQYLARVASLVPREVTAALGPALDSENPAVHRVVVEAASRMPAADAANLVPAICGYLRQSHRGWLDANKLVVIVRRLAEGGETKRAMRLAQVLYRPSSTGQSPSRPDPSGVLDSYWYGETMPTALAALAGEPKMLSAVVVWLEQWDESTPYAGFLRSSWRRSIDTDEEARRMEPVRSALVDAVRDIARTQVNTGRPIPEVVKQIERGSGSIFLRLSLNTIAYALDWLNAARGLAPDDGMATIPDAEVVATAYERMMTPELLADEYQPEYVQLARAALPLLPDNQLRQWERLIAEPPHLTAEQVSRMFGGLTGEPTAVTAGDVARHIGLWQRDLLAWIGNEALTAGLRGRLEALVAAYGQRRELGEFQPGGGFFVGPTSPLSDDDAAKLGPEDLLAYLRSWEPGREPSAAQRFPPSAEGLARAVTRAVAANPVQYALRAEHFIGLRSTYVRAILTGFQDAIGQKHALSWQPILALAAYAAEQPDDGGNTDLGNQDGEAWRYAQQQAARLIGVGLKSDPGLAIPGTLYPAAWQILGPLVHSPDPSPEHEQQYGPPSTDALTLSLNTTRPIAMRAAIQLAMAISQLPAEAVTRRDDSQERTTGEILTALDKHAGPARDGSLAVAAVFGEGLGMLLSATPRWTASHLDSILGEWARRSDPSAPQQAWFDTAWAVLLAGYRPSRGLFEPLKPWFMQRIRQLGASQTDVVSAFSMRSPRQSLADHVLTLYITGQLDQGLDDEAVAGLFGYGDGALLRDVLGHVGWLLLRTEGEIPETILERSRALWDWREQQVAQGDADREELLDFFWWVSSGRLDAGWWLPHLAFVADDPQFKTHEMVGEPLALAAAAHPEQVLGIYTKLHAIYRSAGPSYDLLKHAPAILKPALRYNRADVVERAHKLADQLGNEGYIDLMNDIRALPD
jgi:hypothetical protein